MHSFPSGCPLFVSIGPSVNYPALEGRTIIQWWSRHSVPNFLLLIFLLRQDSTQASRLATRAQCFYVLSAPSTRAIGLSLLLTKGSRSIFSSSGWYSQELAITQWAIKRIYRKTALRVLSHCMAPLPDTSASSREIGTYWETDATTQRLQQNEGHGLSGEPCLEPMSAMRSLASSN